MEAIEKRVEVLQRIEVVGGHGLCLLDSCGLKDETLR